MTQSNYEKYSQHIVYRCLTGSRSYGLHIESSDYDYRGVFIAPSQEFWKLTSPPEQIDKPNADEQYWELGKFVKMALKANPNILEILFSQEDHIDVLSPLFNPIVHHRDKFLSKQVYKTYRGYAQAQIKRMRGKSEDDINWKHAMHMIRLLYSLYSLLSEGVLLIDMLEHREELLNIRAGKHSWNYVDTMREWLEEEIEHWYKETNLPEEPDYKFIESMLIHIRLETLENDF